MGLRMPEVYGNFAYAIPIGNHISRTAYVKPNSEKNSSHDDIVTGQFQGL